MANIEFKGARINFKVYGSGVKRPLVLLHGFLEDLQIWEPIVKEIKNERQVICIDLPGHGKSEGISEVHSMDLMAQVVYEVLNSLEVQEISIAGHSMGGYVSLEFLKNFSMMVKSIVLINSTPAEDSVEKRLIRERSVKLVGRNKKAYIRMAISNLYSEKSRDRFEAEIENLQLRALKMKSKNVQAALIGMKIRTNYLEVLKNYEGQKMILASEEDPILEFSEIERISGETNSEFFRLENGHNSYMEDLSNLMQKMHFID
ncbi:alpha/beta hydrolase [Gramella sp. GC03-9]|uniref:Alpha/beta hydrolase n=1 Tax=Christiangramia oceanisediminis TaxID=2920386 RepID=A0A9X2KWH0_9FLAO|nr:alpha/beta hydrolase [Gramella oceanisediminis]MCP9199453.1 alpha/beta hydrolase [Gramella oceanisediminis]